MYKNHIKYIIDFTISLVAIIVLCPILLTLFTILIIINRGSPLFLQNRPGKDERIFTIIKFKTMKDTKDHSGILLPDSKRLTTVGRFIRKTSLDEIPQLINVLKGDMSLIGPRPLLPEYLPLYDSIQKRRHLVKPGITGWAQINGRNNSTFSERFQYDVWYVDNISFKLDVKIFIITLRNVLTSRGVRNDQKIEEIDDLNFFNK